MRREAEYHQKTNDLHMQTTKLRVGSSASFWGKPQRAHFCVAVFVDYTRLRSRSLASLSLTRRRMVVSRRTSPTTENTTTTSSSGSPKSKRPFFSSPGQAARPKRRSSPRRARMTTPHPHHSPIMNWMSTSSQAEGGCPTDVVPKILAFCGPQTVARLSQINRHWRDLCLAESTWRILCEDLYKVRCTG